MKKRYLLQMGTAALGAIALSRLLPQQSRAEAPLPVATDKPTVAGKTFEVMKTEAEWRRILTPQQFAVLRQHDTEAPFSSPLADNHEAGTYHCAGCNLPLFSSSTKFDSGTGWPSFYAPLAHAIGTTTDHSFFMIRTEVHCRRCGGHLGHVFDDGPAPTGQRYCMNGVALTFVAS